jgi:hypothetical protein
MGNSFASVLSWFSIPWINQYNDDLLSRVYNCDIADEDQSDVRTGMI